MAHGNIGGDIPTGGNDELGELLRAMQHMVTSFRSFADAQRSMVRAHTAGDTDHEIRAADFPGIYGEMAQSTNELANTHINVTRQALDVIQHYASGDLSVNMARLPGKQANITQAMDGVKNSLQSVSREIRELAEAAARGEFKVRGEVGRYQHDFRAMIVDLNRLMEVSDAGLNDIARVLSGLAGGDLTQRITAEYQGTFAAVKADTNSTVAKLNEIVARIKDASNAITGASHEKATVAKIYQGELKSWSDGTPTAAIDLPEDNPTRAAFCTEVVGKSVANLKALWAQMVFSGKALPPKMVASDDDVKKAVSGVKGGVGYIKASAVDDSVKVAFE
jgi:methyl-accepting chemotaxis protein